MKAIDDYPIFDMNIDNMDERQLIVLTRLLLNAEENYGNDERPIQQAECAELLDRVRGRRKEMMLYPEA
jgi:hypothetical protein